MDVRHLSHLLDNVSDESQVYVEIPGHRLRGLQRAISDRLESPTFEQSGNRDPMTLGTVGARVALEYSEDGKLTRGQLFLIVSEEA